MTEFMIRIGGFVFRIFSMHVSTKGYCKDYLIEEDIEEDVKIVITEKDIEYERKMVAEEYKEDSKISVNYPTSLLELTAVYRQVGDYISFHNACVFHGVLIELDGQGYLFTAKSGTGKTTHASNWLKAFPNARIINGDKPILKIEENQVIGYGTPWAGKERIQENDKVAIKAIISLSRGESNEIYTISPGDAFPILMAQMYRPKDSFSMQRNLELSLEILDRVQAYRLFCNMDVESAIVAKNGIE